MGDPRDIRAFSNRDRRSGQGTYLAVNVQQDKMLEQMKRSLDSERQYALRGIESDKNILRSRQLRFRAKVCKIKSHLTEEQIVELKKQDRPFGRRTSKSHLGFTSTTTPMGERTKNQVDKSRSYSAAGRLQTETVTQVLRTPPKDYKSKKAPLPVLVKNQQQIYSHNTFYDDDSDGAILEEDEEDDVFSDYTPTPSVKPGKSASKSGNRTSMSTSLGLPPSTPGSTLTTKKSLMTFSCHDIPLDEGRNSATLGKQSRMSSTNNWSLDETPEDKIRQEIKQMIIDENDRRLEEAQKHTNDFLERVSYDMQRDKRDQEQRTYQEVAEEHVTFSREEQLQRLRDEIRMKKRERMKKGHKGNEDMLEREEGETDEDYTKRMEKWREDMRRIRYLRRRSQRPSQDFTNVVTLVSAGMAANKIWREGLKNNLFH